MKSYLVLETAEQAGLLIDELRNEIDTNKSLKVKDKNYLDLVKYDIERAYDFLIEASKKLKLFE